MKKRRCDEDDGALHSDAPLSQIRGIAPARVLTDHYILEDKIANGSFGIVYKARRKVDGVLVAVKAFIKHAALETGGFQIGTLREISTALLVDHPSFVRAYEVCVDPATRPLTLKSAHKFTLSERKCLIVQLLSAVVYLTEVVGIAHRDIKPGNLLYTNTGHLKICDFGSSRPMRSCGPLSMPIEDTVSHPQRASPSPLTEHVGTLWYESPESLMELENEMALPMGCMDMWSVGCVIHEILRDDSSAGPLFGRCKSKEELLRYILSHSDPYEEWPELTTVERLRPYLRRGVGRRLDLGARLDSSGESEDLLRNVLRLNPHQRLSAREALQHPFITSARPLPQKISFMPSIRESHRSRIRDDTLQSAIS